MKTRIHRADCQGSALLLTLGTTLVIGIAMASYLVFVANQTRSTMRSQSWNSCVPVMEAGVEEALSQINYQGPTNLGTNGWTLGADALYHKTRWFGDSYCDVSIQPLDPPVIFSTGYVPGPAPTASVTGMILGTVNGSTSTPTYTRRTVKVATVKQGTGAGGVNAKGLITVSGSSSYIASYRSSTGPYDKIGFTNRRANALAISNGTTLPTIKVDGKIYGSAKTGPNASNPNGLITGAVGDDAWFALGNTTPEASHVTHDAAVTYNIPTAPFTYGTGFTPIAGAYAGTNYTYVLDGNLHPNFNLSGPNIGGGKSMVVSGNVTLYVSGDMAVSGGGFIYVAPGATLKLYVSQKFTDSGGSVVNGSGVAKNVSLFGLDTTAGKYDWTVSGGLTDFIGTVNAPMADLTVSGGGLAIGSFSANTVTISGGSNVIYDEDLSSGGNYVASSWNEI